jgi:hydroxybutyrate-dimer hydrolase
VPILLLHGLDDGLVPEAFSSGPYARWVQASGRPLRYWRIAHAQHFDNALGLPAMGAAYLPLLPYAWAAADAMHAHLREGAPLGADRDLAGQPRGVQDGLPPPLRREQLGL